jgi:hypothetical protein
VGGGTSLPSAPQNFHQIKNMKTQNHSKSAQSTSSNSAQRHGGLRHSAAKTIEHRYERRKIREQLRHLDWALIGEDEVIA